MTRLLVPYFALVLAAPIAAAHVNDRNMDYHAYKNASNVPCCNNEDCRPATAFTELTRNGQSMVRLLIDGIWIEVGRSHVVAEDAADGRAHWCGIKMFTGSRGGWVPQTRCLILPPKVM
jgi:hypothetical protein